MNYEASASVWIFNFFFAYRVKLRRSVQGQKSEFSFIVPVQCKLEEKSICVLWNILPKQAILLALGLQHKTVEDIEKQLELPVSQVLGLFNRSMRKIVQVLRQLQEQAVEAQMVRRKEITMEPVGQKMEEELVGWHLLLFYICWSLLRVTLFGINTFCWCEGRPLPLASKFGVAEVIR